MLAENLTDACRTLQPNNTEEHQPSISLEDDDENLNNEGMELDAGEERFLSCLILTVCLLSYMLVYYAESSPETANADEDFSLQTEDESVRICKL